MKKLQEYIKKINKERGWDKTTVPELFMYLSEEVGESAKAARQLMNSRVDSKSEKWAGEWFDIDLEKAYWEKEEINKSRTWSKD